MILSQKDFNRTVVEALEQVATDVAFAVDRGGGKFDTTLHQTVKELRKFVDRGETADNDEEDHDA